MKLLQSASNVKLYKVIDGLYIVETEDSALTFYSIVDAVREFNDVRIKEEWEYLL